MNTAALTLNIKRQPGLPESVTRTDQHCEVCKRQLPYALGRTHGICDPCHRKGYQLTR